MSFEVSRAVWLMDVAPNDKIVLLQLADVAGHDGRVHFFRGLKALCALTRLSRATVKRVLARFVQAGIIQVERKADRARHRPALYRLVMAAIAAHPQIDLSVAADEDQGEALPGLTVSPGDAAEGADLSTDPGLTVSPGASGSPGLTAMTPGRGSPVSPLSIYQERKGSIRTVHVGAGPVDKSRARQGGAQASERVSASLRAQVDAKRAAHGLQPLGPDARSGDVLRYATSYGLAEAAPRARVKGAAMDELAQPAPEINNRVENG